MNVESAFEKEFFGEKAEWTHEEIDEIPKNMKKDSLNKRNNSESKVANFEKKSLERAQLGKKNVKIFRKPPLDTNAFTRTRERERVDSEEK